MASLKDKQGTVWELKFTLRTLSTLFRRMNCTLAMLTRMDLPIADLIDSLDLICAKQIKEMNITVEEFKDRIDDVPMEVVITAVSEAIQSSFPSQSDAKGGGNSGNPLDLGTEMTS